jgi:hypothetical protein
VKIIYQHWLQQHKIAVNINAEYVRTQSAVGWGRWSQRGTEGNLCTSVYKDR